MRWIRRKLRHTDWAYTIITILSISFWTYLIYSVIEDIGGK